MTGSLTKFPDVDLRLLVRALVRVPLERVLDAGEEPELVLDDVAAEGRAEVVDLVEVTRGEDDRGAALDGERSGRDPVRLPGVQVPNTVPWNSLPPDLVVALSAPPGVRPYSGM